MVDVARHIRIFDKEPSDDLVIKRSTTIAAMAEKFLKLKTYEDYFQVAEDLAHALEAEGFRVPDNRAVDVEEAIRAESPAFDRDGQDLQILTCLMLAALKATKDAQPTGTAWSRPEIVAVSIWLSLGTQTPRAEPKVESLRMELVEASRNLINRSADGSRARTAIPDPAVKIAELTDVKVVAESINKGLLKTVEALRQNAALDREELDMLWWSLGDWSDLQQEHFRQLPVQVAAVTAGIEGSNLLRRLPSDGHKHLVLRHIVDDSERNAVELVASLGDGAKAIQDAYSGHGHVKKFPHVFRLLATISGENVDTQSLGNRSWGARAMLEATVLRLSQNNNTVL
jgi:hypothetical protein